MSVLSPSQLQKLRYSCQRWLEMMKLNMNRLDGTGYASSLLSIENLGDVELTGIANNDVLRYDLAAGKWKNVNYGFLTTTTTTTTTSTTSSTTSTTSSTTSTTSTTSSTSSTTSSTTTTTTTSTTTTAPPPPTEFICEVGPGQADYATFWQWDNGVGCDLTAVTTQVIGHGGITGTMGDTASVEGQDSGATGTIAHCTSDQILIHTISGTFENGEQIFRVENSDYVVANTAPNSAIAVAEMGTTGAALTTKWEFDNWTTSSTNYIIIRAQSGHEAQVPLDTSRFYFHYTVTSGSYPTCLMLKEDYIRIEDIQFKITVTSASGDVTGIDSGNGQALSANAHDIRFTNCVIRGDGAYAGNVFGLALNANGGNISVKGCFIDGFSNGAGSCAVRLGNDGSNPTYQKFYNNTVYGSKYGVYLVDANNWVGKNNLVDSSATACFQGTFLGWDYNMSSDATAPGGNSQTNATADFDNTGAGDFHIGASSDALGNGTGPSADSEVPTSDIDGTARSGSTCDIGADED